MCAGLQFTSASPFVSSGCELSLQCVTLSLAKKNWLCVMPFWAMIGWHGFRDNQDFRRYNRNKKKNPCWGEKCAGKERDKIGSQVLSRNDQAFFFLMAFNVSTVIKISQHSITDPQSCVAEGIILI